MFLNDVCNHFDAWILVRDPVTLKYVGALTMLGSTLFWNVWILSMWLFYPQTYVQTSLFIHEHLVESCQRRIFSEEPLQLCKYGVEFVDFLLDMFTPKEHNIEIHATVLCCVRGDCSFVDSLTYEVVVRILFLVEFNSPFLVQMAGLFAICESFSVDSSVLFQDAINADPQKLLMDY